MLGALPRVCGVWSDVVEGFSKNGGLILIQFLRVVVSKTFYIVLDGFKSFFIIHTLWNK